ncbi:MAG TPA: hypothetical protein VMV69_07495 [Pirellulales bacterium]|nr:hypothetical protein [Pirellulales bacterium]
MSTRWPEIIWSAITVGRSSWAGVIRHGEYSEYEAIYRALMVFANFKESTNRRIQKTSAYQRLDPSEKGAVSYFFGLAMAKLFAARRFGVPWLMHLGVYHDSLCPVNFNSNLRPDLVGVDFGTRWLVMEAKGRSRKAPSTLMASAKRQTQSLEAIKGVVPSMRTGAITHFPGRDVEVELEDPSGSGKRHFSLDIDEDDLLRRYYRPIERVIDGAGPFEPVVWRNRKLRTVQLPALGVRIGLDDAVIASLSAKTKVHATIASLLPPIAQPLDQNLRDRGQTPFSAEKDEVGRADLDDPERFHFGPDGVAVWLGPEWTGGAMAREPPDRFE